MIWFLVYIVGCVFTYLQCRRNFIELDDKWTNLEVIRCLILAAFSWPMLAITYIEYFHEKRGNKFQKWLEKDLKPKNKKTE